MSTTGTFLCDLIFEAFLRLNIALLAQTSQRGLRKEITMCPIPLRNIVAARLHCIERVLEHFGHFPNSVIFILHH